MPGENNQHLNDFVHSEYYIKFCKEVMKQVFDSGFAQLQAGESTLEYVVRQVKTALQKLNSSCFVCMKPLNKAYTKMRTCGSDACEFNFEENSLGNIFQEVKADPEIAHFLVETAFIAFASGRATDLTEPFPSFLLKNRELRPKEGNLTYIKEAQDKGIDVKEAKQILKDNKNILLGKKYTLVIYSVIRDINSIGSEIEFRH